ncbi:MAG: hypothetical protein EKK42_29460 [Pseudonocardiaceae bacterium]|nr:MAG: hypothetical protein EKK42_29460 [Pseudonocardiaceae bacterium]
MRARLERVRGELGRVAADVARVELSVAATFEARAAVSPHLAAELLARAEFARRFAAYERCRADEYRRGSPPRIRPGEAGAAGHAPPEAMP